MMISRIAKVFSAVCVATILTQFILVGYFLSRGTLNSASLTGVIALLNGIDISGNRLQQIISEEQQNEQPDFDEILDARKMQSYDMDQRLQSQRIFREELTKMLSELREDRDQLDARLAAFRTELNELEQEALNEGLRDAGRAIQVLDAEAAKDQLLIMFDEERIDDVVTIIQAMPPDKRKDILAEFSSENEKGKLADILRLISEGRPKTNLINAARQ